MDRLTVAGQDTCPDLDAFAAARGELRALPALAAALARATPDRREQR